MQSISGYTETAWPGFPEFCVVLAGSDILIVQGDNVRVRSRLILMLLVGCISVSAVSCGREDVTPTRTSPDRTAGSTALLSKPKVASNLATINALRVLTLVGTPEEMGCRHGELLGEEVRWVVERVVHESIAPDDESRRRFIRRVKVMEKFLTESWRRELRALAEAARVDYWELVGLQLFGDVQRAPLCSSFAVFGRATKTGECIVGRNFDYWYSAVAVRASIIIDYHPRDAHRFVTLSWAGVINGWTLMNEHGIVAANNTAYSYGKNSLEGLSTCFMLRKVAEEARTVEEGVHLVEKTPRACSTNLIIAGGNPPAAAIVEYDHERILARGARDDYVLATNSFVRLGQEADDEPAYGRYAVLRELIQSNYGKIDRTMNFAGAEGVPLTFINLHSALLFPRDLTFRAAMGHFPACQSRYRWFRMTPEAVVSAEPRATAAASE